MNRRPAPPGIIAAAEQSHAAMQDTLASLIGTVRTLLDRQPTEIEVITEVWLTLLHNPTREATMLGATAIVQLAKHPTNRPQSHPPDHDAAHGTSDRTDTPIH